MPDTYTCQCVYIQVLVIILTSTHIFDPPQQFGVLRLLSAQTQGQILAVHHAFDKSME